MHRVSRNHFRAMTAATNLNNSIEYGNQDATSDLSTDNPATLVLASYNIRYGVGRFLISSGLLRKGGVNLPARRSEAVARNLKTAARALSDGTVLPRPDILALQEADKETGRAGRHHVAAELAHYLGVPYAHVAAGIPRGVQPKEREWWLNFEEQIALYDSGDTGVALLNRVPLKEVARIDLPWRDCAWRPRVAIGATVALDGQDVRVLNVHIDPHASLDGQHEQLTVVLNHADKHTGPSVILGDFNTLSKEKAVDIRCFMEAHSYTTPFPTGTPTWRGAALRFHADWIFVRGVRVIDWGVAKRLNVSDHWPIWAEIEGSS